jgi:hypothetical protein
MKELFRLNVAMPVVLIAAMTIAGCKNNSADKTPYD